MNADNLGMVVRDHFKLRAERFEPDSRIAVDYVLNWGGFLNFSYRVSDGWREYHLKLSTTADGRSALRRWMHLAPLLERHHAPPTIEWMDLGVAAGLLFRAFPDHLRNWTMKWRWS